MDAQSPYSSPTASRITRSPVHQQWAAPYTLFGDDSNFPLRAYLECKWPEDEMFAIITSELAAIIEGQSDLSNVQLYESLHSALCGPYPLEREPLMLFVNLAAQAIQDVVKLRAEAALEAPKPEGPKITLDVHSWTTLLFAEHHPEAALERLQALQCLSASDRNASLVYRLADFIGCSDLEIAQLTEMPLDAVKHRRARAFAMVRPDLAFLPKGVTDDDIQ